MSSVGGRAETTRIPGRIKFGFSDVMHDFNAAVSLIAAFSLPLPFEYVLTCVRLIASMTVRVPKVEECFQNPKYGKIPKSLFCRISERRSSLLLEIFRLIRKSLGSWHFNKLTHEVGDGEKT